MTVRDELRQHIRAAVAGALAEAPSYTHDADELVTDALITMFHDVRRTYGEIDVTTFGDAEERIMWHQDISAELRIPVHHGEYRKPLAGGWTCLP